MKPPAHRQAATSQRSLHCEASGGHPILDAFVLFFEQANKIDADGGVSKGTEDAAEIGSDLSGMGVRERC